MNANLKAHNSGEVRVYIPKENMDIIIRNAFSSLLRCKLIEFVKFVRLSEINQSFKYV